MWNRLRLSTRCSSICYLVGRVGQVLALQMDRDNFHGLGQRKTQNILYLFYWVERNSIGVSPKYHRRIERKLNIKLFETRKGSVMTVINLAMERNRKARKKAKPTNVDGIKFFSAKEIKLLRRHVRQKAEADLKCRRKTAVREWMAIDLLTCTGLRVSEAANLKIGDLNISYGNSSIFVRNGKGNISGTVEIPANLKKHLKQFLRWKKEQGEGTCEDDFLFVGQRGKWTSQAIQQIVKKYLKQLNLYQNGKSVHALRHSYAVALYSKERDLRTVQRQLRHRSIQSTLVYADVTTEEIQSQIRGLWT